MSEKDVAKLEKNCRKLEEALVKSDRDYKESNIKTEEARLAWETAMYRCCQVSGCKGSAICLSPHTHTHTHIHTHTGSHWRLWSWRGVSRCS